MYPQPKIYGDKAQDNMEMIEKAEEDDDEDENEDDSDIEGMGDAGKNNKQNKNLYLSIFVIFNRR